MSKSLEILWHGRVRQGVTSAAALLAEIFAAEGHYVQAFPDSLTFRQSPFVTACNRLSASPVRLHSPLTHAEVVVVMDAPSVETRDICANAGDDAVYIINSHHDPRYIKEKLPNAVKTFYTLDARTIAKEETGNMFPNIPLMAIVVRSINRISIENFKIRLTRVLTDWFPNQPNLVTANLKTVDRALKEVREPEKEPDISSEDIGAATP